MLCLALLFRGKIGKIIRKLAFLIFVGLLIYGGLWILIVKSLKFETGEITAVGNRLAIQLKIINNSFSAVDLINLDFVDKNGAIVKKTVSGLTLPQSIPAYSNKSIRFIFEQAEYKKSKVTLKALLKKHTFESPLNAG